ncbi:MAG: hypothetical protein C4532_14495, partial [Candidatus Abyssobacteria bacterium SURF_17]
MTHLPSGDYTYAYNYYDSNLIQKITYPDGKYAQFEYDDLYRLTNEYARDSGGGLLGTNGYDYDLAENRTGKSNGLVEGYTINALNQVTSIYEVGEDPHTTFEYDLNGNMTSRTVNGQTTCYTYDRENRLRFVYYPPCPDGGSTDFRYDALGRRFKVVQKDAGGQVVGDKRFVYDGLDL